MGESRTMSQRRTCEDCGQSLNHRTNVQPWCCSAAEGAFQFAIESAHATGAWSKYDALWQSMRGKQKALGGRSVISQQTRSYVIKSPYQLVITKNHDAVGYLPTTSCQTQARARRDGFIGTKRDLQMERCGRVWGCTHKDVVRAAGREEWIC